MFQFKDINEFDDRSAFANEVCHLFLENQHSNLRAIIVCRMIDKLYAEIEGLETIYDYFEGHVRNIYQFIDSEIPLFALYQLVINGAKNWNFTEEEYTAAINRTLIACELYYNLKKNH